MKFGDWVASARRFHRLSVAELADMARVSISTIRHVEGNDHSPSIRVAERICAALGFELWRALKIVAEGK